MSLPGGAAPTAAWGQKAIDWMGSHRTPIRYGVGAGLGLMAISRAQRSLDSLRYRDLSGTVLNAGMAAAAGFAAYHAFIPQSTMRSHALNWGKTQLSNLSAKPMFNKPGVSQGMQNVGSFLGRLGRALIR